ncbi:MAG: hypothetical protein LBJ70_03800, partial [Holosporales bacterium]|nr:hypothetical protein [Holosporales bacterium]
MKRLWRWSLESYGVLLSLCIVYPVLFFLRNNSHMFRVSEIAESLGLVLLCCLPLFLIDVLARSLKLSGWKQKLLDVCAVGVGLTVIVITVVQPALHYWFISLCDNVRLRHIVWCLPSPLLSLLALRWRKKFATVSILILSVVAVLVTIQREYRSAQIDRKILGPDFCKPLPITFKKKPNVYLFFLESYTDNKSLEEIYHTSSAELMQCLDKQGFTVLDSCFANYCTTLPSLSSVFLMEHHYYQPTAGDSDISRGLYRVLNGENPVVQTFKAHGYRINAMDCGRGHVSRGDSSVDAYFCAHPERRFKDILPYYRLREVLGNLGLITEEEGDEYPEFLLIDTEFLLARLRQQQEEKVPQFYCIYAGAGHSSCSLFFEEPERLDRHEIEIYPGAPRFMEETYPRARREADRELIRVLEMIHEHDPEALVILIGDQAPHRYNVLDYGWEGDVNARIRSWGIEPSLVARDNVAVLCAIKWGFSPRYFTKETVVSHVNLIRLLFAGLAENPSILENCVQNISLVSANIFSSNRLYLVAEENKLASEWKKFT